MEHYDSEDGELTSLKTEKRRKRMKLNFERLAEWNRKLMSCITKTRWCVS